MKIRKAEENDIPRLLALLEQVLTRIHAKIRFQDILYSAAPPNTLSARLAELLNQEDKPIYCCRERRMNCVIWANDLLSGEGAAIFHEQ